MKMADKGFTAAALTLWSYSCKNQILSIVTNCLSAPLVCTTVQLLWLFVVGVFLCGGWVYHMDFLWCGRITMTHLAASIATKPFYFTEPPTLSDMSGGSSSSGR